MLCCVVLTLRADRGIVSIHIPVSAVAQSGLMLVPLSMLPIPAPAPNPTLFCWFVLPFALHLCIRPMSLPEVLQLPEVCVQAGSRLEGDSCPVCLETYRVGDKVGEGTFGLAAPMLD